MKKLVSICLALLMLVTSAGAIDVYVDGQKLESDVPAQVIDGRTLVPLSPIMQAIGASVTWNSETKTAIAVKDDTTVQLQIGSTTANINGKEIPLDVPAQTIDGRTMVPAAFIADSIGAKTYWNPETKTVRIVTQLYDVVRVIDGDTFVVGFDGREETVRLIGVDTPESVHPTASKNTEAGKAAANFTRYYLENTQVELEFDIQERDQYGRILAYAYVEGEMFNEKLLRTGYASVDTYPPNVKYVERFTNIEKNRDPSLPSKEYLNGAMKAPAAIFNLDSDQKGMELVFMYADGKIGAHGTFGEYKYRTIKTEFGDMAIIDSAGVEGFKDLQIADNAKVGFVYSGYMQTLNMPTGIYVGTFEVQRETTVEKPQQESRTVYVTKTGKRYHYSSSCNGGRYYPSTLSEAISRGLSPCNKCAN